MKTQCIKCDDKYVLFGDDTMQNVGDLIIPINRDKIIDWNAMDAIWRYTVNKIGIGDIEELYDFPLMITETPGINKKMREKKLQHFMEKFNVQKFYMMNTALANFYYTGKTRNDYGVIVDSGHQTTNISCIYMGCYLPEYASIIEYAGKDITDYLSLLINHNDKKIANEIKKDYCYISRNFRLERSKNNVVTKNYILPDGKSLVIKNEQYEAPEILFSSLNKQRRPSSKYSKNSLQSILINCVNKIDDDDVEKDMYANIYCCGGSVKIKNFAARLQSELTNALSRKVSIVSPQHIRKGVIVKNVDKPQFSAWFGCKMISLMDIFNDKWITAEEYNEYGANILEKKCTHQDL